MAPARPCSQPKCRETATAHGRCEKHQRASSFDRGYLGRAWAAYSTRWLKQYPWCGMRGDGQFHTEHSACARRGLRVKARVVDHILSLAFGGARMDPRNHQSLCVSCNTAKGLRDAIEFDRAGGTPNR